MHVAGVLVPFSSVFDGLCSGGSYYSYDYSRERYSRETVKREQYLLLQLCVRSLMRNAFLGNLSSNSLDEQKYISPWIP